MSCPSGGRPSGDRRTHPASVCAGQRVPLRKLKRFREFGRGESSSHRGVAAREVVMLIRLPEICRGPALQSAGVSSLVEGAARSVAER